MPQIAHPAVRFVAAAASLGVAVLAGLACSAASAQGGKNAVATPWKVVYEHYNSRIGDGGTGIDIVTSDLRRPRVLATRPKGSRTHYRDPDLSPDGTHVAYVRSLGHEELYVIRTDGTGRRRLASGEFRNYVWSPDGTKLAFVVDCAYDFEGGCRHGHIDVIRRDGAGHRVLLRPSDLSAQADIDLQGWSQQGELLYRVENRGRRRLYSLGTGGRKPSVLADTRTGGELGEAAWSPDGNQIAYKRGCTNFRSETLCDVAVMTRDGSSKRLLWNQDEPSGWPSYDAPTWIPGSNLLLVALWGSGQTRLLDPSTGRSRRFAKEPWRTIAVNTSGARVATIEDEIAGVDHVLIARPDGSIHTRSALPRRAETYPDDPDLWVG